MLIDRPAARIAAGLRGHPGAPGSFRAGHDPRALRAGRQPSATTACSPRCPTTSSRGCTGLPASRPIEYFAALCLLLELDRPFSALLLDQRRRPRAAVRRADRAHELRRARALRRPPLPLRRQLPRARPRAARRSTPTSCSTATRPACARSTRPSTARGCGKAGCTASRPRSRSSPSATTSASRRCRRRVPGLVLANTTQVYPEDRGTNYAVRLGEEAAAGGARMTALGVDVGGTFTDAVLVGPDGMVTAKVLSTARQEEGVVAAAREVLERAGVEPGDVDALRARLDGRHQRAARAPRSRAPRSSPPRGSATCCSSAARRGRASTACTRRRRRRWWSGGCCVEVDERMGPDGVVRELDEASVERAARRLARARVRGRRRVPAVRVPRPGARGARGGDPARRAAGRVRGRLARGGCRGARVRARDDRHGRRRARAADRPLPRPAARRRPRRPGCPSRT